MPQVGVESRLPFISLPDTNQVIHIAQVKFGKHRGMHKWFKRGAKEWKGVFIFNSDIVDLSVVNTGPQAAVLLRHEEEPRSHGGQGRPYDA